MTNTTTSNEFRDKDFWKSENLSYQEPYFRLEKCAKIVNSLASSKELDLLDIGCGPATLSKLINENINYYGIDIAIHNNTPNIIEKDFVNNEIEFNNKKFDIVVAAGVFEYVGEYQDQKLIEIQSILKDLGVFIVTYTNFKHINKVETHSPFNNVRSIKEFERGLKEYFKVSRWYPSSYNWVRSEPRNKWIKQINMHINFNIPVLAPLFAVNYFFICRKH